MKAYLTITTLVMSIGLCCAQQYSPEDLESLKSAGMQCDSIGRVSLAQLSAYYYYQGNHPKARHYVHKELECLESIWDGAKATKRDSINALNSRYRLLSYHQVASGKDSVQYAADLFAEFSR